MSNTYHIPVLLHQSIDALIKDENGIYVDATFGGGGHSKEILNRLNKEGKLFAFDQDKDATGNKIEDERFILIEENFRYLKKFLRLHAIQKVDGILADLGVSSHQFDKAERGFSTRFDADLDMRMNAAQKISAKDVINNYNRKQLQEIFSRYGEIRNSKQLSEAIADNRTAIKINTTSDLKEIIKSVVKGELNKYLAQVFQAIRIEVNDEMNALKEMLQSTIDVLKPGGRLVVISYHSLEDRIVKNILKTGNTEGEIKEDIKGNKEKYFNIITKKPIEPDDNEIKTNTRSRSARMRVGVKT
ncbi:MAG: 16S rRNA (cytosine(1402)-N(4))-methyltransferase RsmH [Fimbriimonadaceae bacterium]|nr:16S rRNA (cytosine(1402)-N(4))-methyltransferase RsmH [Chitinophagales bacterium]